MDQLIPLTHNLISKYPESRIVKELARLKDVDLHPIYNRDFFQGLFLGLNSSVSERRLRFHNRNSLLEFLQHGDHDLNIRFCKPDKTRQVTRCMYFMSLPYRGRFDNFLAGAVSAATPVLYDNDLMFQFSKKTEPELKRSHVLYETHKDSVLISPFYVMILSGLLPIQIYSEFVAYISTFKTINLKRASFDALMHWRNMYGTRPFKRGMLPFLMDPPAYVMRFGLKAKERNRLMVEKRFDFVSREIVQLCSRWYNTYSVEASKTEVSKAGSAQ